MQKTKIEHLDYTYNPIAMRCTPISPGCAYCWHLAMAKRLTANPLLPRDEQFAYAEDSDPDKGPPVLRRKELEAPLHLKKPARVGVQFMGDLFHEDIKDGFLFSIFGIMASEEVGKHSFFVLSKRPQRMADWIDKFVKFNVDPSKFFERVWLGVSVEDQKTADERIPTLLQIPAAHRWVSVEPYLGSINLEPWLSPCGYYCDHDSNGGGHRPDKSKIDWVIVGGETGPGARPMHPDWVRSLRDQCQAAGVPFFFKHWGEWAWSESSEMRQYKRFEQFKLHRFNDGTCMYRIGHKHSGHFLDGKEWRKSLKPVE